MSVVFHRAVDFGVVEQDVIVDAYPTVSILSSNSPFTNLYGDASGVLWPMKPPIAYVDEERRYGGTQFSVEVIELWQIWIRSRRKFKKR